MELILTKSAGGRSFSMTQRVEQATWSGDKGTIARRLDVTTLRHEAGPEVEIGDFLRLSHGGQRLFEGWAVWQRAQTGSSLLTWYAYDKGMWLKNNDGTVRCDGETPEGFTRRLCADFGIPVAALPSTGVQLRRKFSGVAIAMIFATVWSLAEARTGRRYSLRMTPDGLLVKVREQSRSSLVLRSDSNLYSASTTKSIVNMTNSVGIYSKDGQLLRTLQEAQAVKLYGQMERHLVQRDSVDVDAQARYLLEDGALDSTVTVRVRGDASLVTGETVMARDAASGLEGLFWIDSDRHIWRRGTYICELALNCRNVTARSSAGSEV